MEKKAKKFVALLAKKFTDDDTTDDSIHIFKSAVSNLKAGRLKSELLNKSEIYQKNFIRHLEHLPEEHRKQVDKEYDTSFTMCCHTVADSLERLTVDSPEFLQWTKTILKRGGNSKHFHTELQALNSLLCSRDDYGSVVNTMFLVLSSLQDKVEACVETKNPSRCSGLQKELRMLLTSFHIKHHLVINNMNEVSVTGKQRYEDVLASLLSLYVDLVLVSARSTEDPGAVAKELCSFVSLLMSSWPKHVLDVLLQTSLLYPADGVVILPLARKCLKIPLVKPENKLYTKYVLCSRSVMSTFGEEVLDIRQVAESVKAPSTYLNWLREQRPDLLDNFPEDRKFKGRVITKFLLHEADESIIDTLLDILTKEFPEPGEANPDEFNNKQTIETIIPEVLGGSDMPLFFIDTKGRKDKLQNDSPRKLKSDSDNQAKPLVNNPEDNVEVIEVDLTGFDTVMNAGIEDWEKDNDDCSDLLESDVLVIDKDRSIDDTIDVDDDSDDDSDNNSDTDDWKISESEVVNDISNKIDKAERDTVVCKDNKIGGVTEGDTADNDNDDDEVITDNDADYDDGDNSDDNTNADDIMNDDDACGSKSDDKGTGSVDIDDESDQDDEKTTDDDDGDDEIENVHEMKKVRGKTPILSKLRSTKSPVVRPSPIIKRVRTRSVSSLENDTSGDLTQGRQVDPHASPLRNSRHEGKNNSHYMRERPKEVQSPCLFCAEPHCDSSTLSSCAKQTRLSGTDVEHSPSKKTKIIDESSSSEDSVKKSSKNKDRSRRSLPSRRKLSASRSRQYNLRRKSAV